MDPPGKPQRRPFVVECEPGKYAHCQCQQSSRYPYCDGSHRGTDKNPIKVVVEERKTIAWCACGNSGNMPYCDGTHGRI
ncbi:MAG: CDGSH iron-sulfur domain-containing protein [Planctomycetes bacterium]|nr:CDGSH iron-sulfur domain-containing protein [Planctomycetota bacterium]